VGAPVVRADYPFRRCLSSLLRQHPTFHDGVPLSRKVIDIARVAASTSGDPIRETTISVLGSFGRYVVGSRRRLYLYDHRDGDHALQSLVIEELVCVLGHDNSSLRGLAWIQVNT
jgi:hypothetical protein